MKKIIFYSVALLGLLLSSCSNDEETDYTLGKWSYPVLGTKGTSQTITWEDDSQDVCPISSFEFLNDGIFKQTLISKVTGVDCPTTVPTDADVYTGTYTKSNGDITLTTMGQNVELKIISSTANELIVQAYQQSVLLDAYYKFTK